jgi:intracellular sulfur oxidation DsrE/DsrF family protein
MADYLLFESRDPFDCAEVGSHWALAEGLARDAGRVTLFLVQNGVLTTRPGARARELARLAAAGVEVLADDFSLRERGIPPARLPAGVKAASIDAALDRLAEGRKALWF